MSGRGSSRLVALGAVLAGAAVALGAFGSHGLKGRVDAEALGWWQTGAQYLLPHGVAVMALGLAARPAWRAPGLLLASGSAVFAGTLAAMALGAPRWLGAVTPAGGLLMIGGWALLAWRARRGVD
ncbi:DUF423 domain-containing protein [Sphingomonas sp. BN140010]|uniref:DUF423 domain-containing protein n=1 Tax=Sphingomonas arvum TaxID=2992113 RepID=A0ABT3JGP7_9SPHN|nr:DUF423 domain-containing protein [Sphingomonas sp. BN140010]MCW3798264.1 DUF423 domain-containing protein [Sphingomonas sp. BN140010]